MYLNCYDPRKIRYTEAERNALEEANSHASIEWINMTEIRDPSPMWVIGMVAERQARRFGPCSLGMGCDEAGVCYAEANGAPERCGRR